MSNLSSIANRDKINMAFLLASKPTVPLNAKRSRSENRVSDPSANNPSGRSYPVPSYFDYRLRPKDFESL